MGAGIGKTKRAQLSSTTSNALRAHLQANTAPGSHPEIWHRFVDENDLRNQTLSDYYEVQTDEYGEIGKDDACQLVQEVFADFVNTGGLTLPPGHGLDDYELLMRPQPDQQQTVPEIVLQDLQSGRSEHVLSRPSTWFTKYTKFASREMEGLLYSLGYVLGVLSHEQPLADVA